jgi:hypothetical protein
MFRDGRRLSQGCEIYAIFRGPKRMEPPESKRPVESTALSGVFQAHTRPPYLFKRKRQPSRFAPPPKSCCSNSSHCLV